MGVTSYIRNGDTGLLSGTSSSGNVFFNNVWFNPSSGIVVWQSAGRVCTITDFSGTLNTQVIGAEVFVQNTYTNSAGSGTNKLNIQISIDGGTNFSDAIATPALNETTTTDYTLGDSKNTWGLTWPSTLDYSNIRIKGTSVGGAVFSTSAQIKFYFTNPPPTNKQSQVSRKHEFRISGVMLEALQNEKNFVFQKGTAQGTQELFDKLLDMEDSGSYDGSFTDDGWSGHFSGSLSGSVSASLRKQILASGNNNDIGMFKGYDERGVTSNHGILTGSMIGFDYSGSFTGQYPSPSYTYDFLGSKVTITNGRPQSFFGGTDSSFSGSFSMNLKGSIDTLGTLFTGSFATFNKTTATFSGSGDIKSKSNGLKIVRPLQYWKEARKPNARKVTNLREENLGVSIIKDRPEISQGVKTDRMSKFEERRTKSVASSGGGPQAINIKGGN
tara:strand:+ start:4237 stop:5562 length:1326 start_codon:yes stop_codon:yes gene_type:complete